MEIDPEEPPPKTQEEIQQEKQERDQQLTKRSLRIENEDKNSFWTAKTLQELQEEAGDIRFEDEEDDDEEGGEGGWGEEVKRVFGKGRRFAKNFFSQIIMVVGVLGLIPFLFLEIGGGHDDLSNGFDENAGKRGKAAGVAFIMALYWVTETIPIPATAMIPMFLLPLFSILSSKVVCSLFFNDTIALFIATNIIGLAMGKYRLHERIALLVLLKTGQNPKMVVLGVMLVTALLSMFMSNTATTTVMAPLVVSLFASLNSNENGEEYDPNEEINITELTASMNEKEKIFLKAALLATAYSASVGGAATLIGTGTNLAFVAVYEGLFPLAPEIAFSQWLFFAAPFIFVCLIVIWLWLILMYMRHTKDIRICLDSLKDRYRSMGEVTMEQKIILVDVGITMFLWLTRSSISHSIRGWGEWFLVEEVKCKSTGCVTETRPIGDSAVAMAAALLLFFLPTFTYDEITEELKVNWRERMMTWRDCRDLSWGVALLLGSGYALATAFTTTGLSASLGNFFYQLGALPLIIFILFACLFVSLATEFISNVAMANLILPIAAELAIAHCENPLVFMVPATMACSFAFMMPAATPPNAIVFSFNLIQVSEMVKTGFLLDIICVVLLAMWCFFMMPVFFDMKFGFTPYWIGENDCTNVYPSSPSSSPPPSASSPSPSPFPFPFPTPTPSPSSSFPSPFPSPTPSPF